jgi:hypothetical protein
MTTSATTTTPSLDRRPALALDDLLVLDTSALLALYREGTAPHISDLDGDLEGRMLASPLLGKELPEPLRRFARSRRFPWRGKAFRSKDEGRGEGINVFVPGKKLFRYETRIAPSRAGDFDAVHLDYDRPGNPFLVRRTKDEIRAVRPGLFLGQAYLDVLGRARLVAWFALAKR